MISSTSLFNVQSLSEEQIKLYWQEGYLVIPGAIAKSWAETLRGEVLDIFKQLGQPLNKLSQSPQYLAGSNLDRLINGPETIGLAEQLLGGPSSHFCIFTAAKAGGGGGRFHFHQDNQYTRFEGPGINLWFALEKMTAENGCLQIVPRSHLNGTLESVVSGDGDTHKKITWEPADFVPVLMEAGDCVAFSRVTVHGSGVNSSSEPRIGYAVQFHRDDVLVPGPDGQMRRLKDFPPYNLKPVAKIIPPQDDKKLEGH
jgi:hypothetical protein